ncbi:hypothetical protein IAU60_002955 [Kwoniella sp. DSM 27419]
MADIDPEIAARCVELQQDELTVLESIYPGQVQVHPNPSDKPGSLLNLNISIALATPLTVQLDSTSGPSGSLQVSHLPPINVRMLLPSQYPVMQAAKPIVLRAPLPSGDNIGNWLPKTTLRAVQDKLTEYYEEEREMMGEGTGVLWRWWEWVSLGIFTDDLGMIQGGTLKLAVPPMLSPSAFYTALKTYNAGQIHSDFEKTAFSCSICLENRKGKTCVQMPACGCVFCTPCLSSCWSLAITEGSLESVSCPSVSCTKTRALRDRAEAVDSVDAELVESVVGKELRVRWEDIKERRKAEIDPTYTVCPRPTCQAAVPPPAEPSAAIDTSRSSRVIRLSDISTTSNTSSTSAESPASPSTSSIPTEDRWARYRSCPKCHFSFCLYCNATWHGPHTLCAFPQTSVIVKEYLSYPEGSDARQRMEQRRGKANLERMVAQHLEDEANKQWLEGKTRACSGCGVRVEKSHGCNHMTCGRCQAHFCYRCGDPIKPTDPYKHFNTPGKPCYMKLFDLDEVLAHERATAGIADDAFEDEWREPRGIWEW